MILAAGGGERLRPLTDTVPKPLLKAGGTTLIAWQVARLVAVGWRDLVVNHAHLGALIEQSLGDGARFGATIRYSREAEALESAGGIAQALPLLGAGPFLVTNADVYTAFDYAALAPRLATLDGERRLAHLVLVPNPAHHRNGDFVLTGERVSAAGAPRLGHDGFGDVRQPRECRADRGPVRRGDILRREGGGKERRRDGAVCQRPAPTASGVRRDGGHGRAAGG